MHNKEEKNKSAIKMVVITNAISVALVLAVFFGIHPSVSGSSSKLNKDAGEIIRINPFEQIAINAKAVYVYDIAQDKVIFQKNEFAQLPLASITKLMTALVATEILPDDSKVTIRKEFLREEGDSGLLSGESWSIKDLVDFSLVVSSNDGARALASVAGAFDLKNQDYDLGRKDFVLLMNKKAQELDLKQTYFINESGLDSDGLAGGYGSAIDVAKLMQYILQNNPKILEATKYKKIEIKSENKKHLAKNTNEVVESIPGLLASKTGYTDMAGGNLVVAFDSSIGKPVVVVVLGSTEEGRFDDVSSLVKASLEYITN